MFATFTSMPVRFADRHKNMRNVRTPDMNLAWRNAHSHINYTVSTFDRERES